MGVLGPIRLGTIAFRKRVIADAGLLIRHQTKEGSDPTRVTFPQGLIMIFPYPLSVLFIRQFFRGYCLVIYENIKANCLQTSYFMD